MNGVILYQSKYGMTRKYAQWLFDATHFDLLEMKQAKGTDLSRYEVIVFGGGIYASGIAGLNALKKQLAHLSPRKVVIFCVGASPYDEKALAAVKEHNMDGPLKDKQKKKKSGG